MERHEIVAELLAIRDLIDQRDRAGEVQEMDRLSAEITARIDALVDDLRD